MPYVKSHTRNGRRVRGHYRRPSSGSGSLPFWIIVIIAALAAVNGFQ